MQPTPKNLLALGLATSMALAACGGDVDTAPAQSGEPRAVPTEGTVDEPPVGEGPSAVADEPSVEDAASMLRAELTGLLEGHVYLAGITFEAALDAGGDLTAPAVSAASDVLDDNTVALADVIGEVAGADQREAFLELWRDHIVSFTDYALATARGDDPAAAEAVNELEAYEQAAAEFLSEVTAGELAVDAAMSALETHVNTLLDAIDALIADDPRALEVLQTAAEHMQETAQALASAIVSALPDEFPGEAASQPAEILATVSYLLREHVYLSAVTVEQAVEGRQIDPSVAATSGALLANAEGLADVIGIAADAEWEASFLDLWNSHEASLLEYGIALATGDQAMAESARTRLEGFHTGMGALFDDITAAPTDAVVISQAFENIVRNLLDSIETIVGGDPLATADLRDVAQQTDTAAMLIAEAIVVGAR